MVERARGSGQALARVEEDQMNEKRAREIERWRMAIRYSRKMSASFGERVGACSQLGECCPGQPRAWSVRSRREHSGSVTLCARPKAVAAWLESWLSAS